jgi:hypothetical protein
MQIPFAIDPRFRKDRDPGTASLAAVESNQRRGTPAR